MAAAFPPPNDPNDPNDPFDPPRFPCMVRKDEAAELSPDTEQHVEQETDGVFRSFVAHLYNISRNSPEADPDSPRHQELTTLTAQIDAVNSPATRIGRQLALIGDEIQTRYNPEFNQMIRMLNLTPETAYEAFAGVARKLFRDGQVSWGRIVTLLCFGYRMAVTVLQCGIRGFFSRIASFIVRFIVSERIARWIADQGGWRAVLQYIPDNVGWSTIGAIATVAALSILAAFFMTRKS